MSAPDDIEKGAPSLSSLGANPAEQIKEAITRFPVTIFGRSACPFTIEAMETFTRLSAPHTDFLMDKMPSAEHKAIHSALKEQYKQSTVPYVFVNGEFLGGCDDTKGLLASGKLMPMLYHILPSPGKSTVTAHITTPAVDSVYASAVTAAQAKADEPHGKGDSYEAGFVPAYGELRDPVLAAAVGRDTQVVHRCLFWFPEQTDGHAARVIALITWIISLITIIWREENWAHYLMLGLFIDCVLRLLFGGGPSPIAQFSRAIFANVEPHFVPGFPKQFAAFCACFFSGTSALFYLLSFDDPKNIAGATIAAMLVCAAVLESIFDWCAGCWMFGLGVNYGLLPKNIYTISTNSKAEAQYAYKEATQKVELMPTEVFDKPYQGHPPSIIDYHYKTKNDDNERQEFNIIKHSKVTHFNMTLGIVGLASVWKAAAATEPSSGLYISETPSKVLQIITAVIFGLQLVLYAIKFLKYPKKVHKEWMCPLRGNFFSVPSMILMLLAYNINGEFDNSEDLAKVLYWIGAVTGIIVAMLIVSGWVALRRAFDHMNNAWIMAPVGLLVAAWGIQLDDSYLESSYFFFGFAAICWFMLVPVLFYKAVVFVDADERLRPSVFIWIAPPAIAFVVYNTLVGVGLDFIGRILFYSGLSIGLIVGYLFWRGHLSRTKFDPTAGWAYVFPLDALAIAVIIWSSQVDGNWPHGMAITALVISSVACLVCFLQSLVALLAGGFFVTDPKYGPLSQQKLTHEAFRGALPKLLTALDALDGEVESSQAVADFGRQFKLFHLAHAWHSTQEERVLFKMMDEWVPGATAPYREDHYKDEPMFAGWGAFVLELEGGCDKARRTAIISQLKTELPAFCEDLKLHLIGEEIHLQPIPRKYVPIEVQKQALVKIWEITPAEVWADYFPWIVNNLPTIGMRVKFIRCWLWGMPERAQQIGRMLALNCDAVMWTRLKEYVPEIAPKGDPDYRRYY